MPVRGEMDRKAMRQGRALVDLVRSHFPIEAPVDRPSAWLLVGPGLIARATGSLESILTLAPLHRETDAGTLLRSLYEHVTTFAWLGADPSEDRMRRWDKADMSELRMMDNDLRASGVQFLRPKARRKLERSLAEASSSKNMPSLLDRAEAADAHWSGKITCLRGPGTLESFRGLYAVGYRSLSVFAHPSSRGLTPVMTGLDDGPAVIQLDERHEDRAGPLRPAIDVYALGLHVCAATLGWPTQRDIDAIVEQ
jgi:uncharacterized protein DUF5677